jgi:DNA end-binding protein Ku
VARAIWTGSISFGLVSIPIRLHAATSPKDIRFREVDRRTGRRVHRRTVVREPEPSPSGDDGPSIEPSRAEEDQPARPPERTVARDEVIKAFEVEPGRVVEVEREEIEAARAEQTRTIEIEQFVQLADIDPVYFEKSYHLAPGGDLALRPYALLHAAMERSGRVAIGRFVLRTKEHLVAVRPTRGILGLETLYYADEVHQPEPAWLQTQEPSEREVEMSLALIEALEGEWRPEDFEDRDRTRLMEVIAAKAPRQLEPEEEDEVAAAGGGPAVPDLMEALRASVEAIQASQPGKKRKQRR